MSRLASKPIILPEGYSCVVDGSNINVVKGGKTISVPFNSDVLSFKTEGSSVLFSNRKDVKIPVGVRGLLGTTIALFKIAVRDLKEGHQAKLNLVGVGYRASVVKSGKFNYLKILVGFSHPIFIFIPSTLTISMEKETIIVSGSKTSEVMNFCAKVRSQKKPTVYHGTGVIMNNEVIIKKVGKKK